MKLQHQMKHNSEELQDFLRDMGNWAKEIGIKDEQLRKRKAESHSKVFQPLRSVDELKRKVVVEAPDEDDSSSKVEKKTKVNTRIPSYEYDAWAKFDVDKALEEVDVVDHEKQEIEEVMELTDEMKLQKAIVEKDKGNDYFKVAFFKRRLKRPFSTSFCLLFFSKGDSRMRSNVTQTASSVTQETQFCPQIEPWPT